MYDFDAITVEILYSSTTGWVDVSADVLQEPAPRWSRGILSNTPLERMAGPGSFTFALNNSAFNSQEIEGYYSPSSTAYTDGTAFWGNYHYSARVRLSFLFEGVRWYKFLGYTTHVEAEPGTKEGRKVYVSATDYMGMLANQTIETPEYQTNIAWETAIPLIFDQMWKDPEEYHIGAGKFTYATVFDTTREFATARSELHKLNMAEMGWMYIQGNTRNGETFLAKPYTTESTYSGVSLGNSGIPKVTAESDNLHLETADDILLETGDHLKMNQSQTFTLADGALSGSGNIRGDDLYTNYFKVISYPRDVDDASTTVLFTLRDTPAIAASSTQSLRGIYRDPANLAEHVCGIEMVTPVATTDYAANSLASSTGTDMTTSLGVTATYGTEAVEYDLVNNSTASTLYVTKLQARGKGVYIYDKVEKVYDNSSTTVPLTNPQTLNLYYCGNTNKASAFAYSLVSYYNGSDRTWPRFAYCANTSGMTMYGFLRSEPPSGFVCTESLTDFSGSGIYGYEAEIVEGRYVVVYLNLRETHTFTMYPYST